MDTHTIKYSIGIDIGASKASIGLLDKNGTILGRSRLDIRTTRSDSSETIEVIQREMVRVVQGSGLSIDLVDFIGIGVPGTVDASAQRVLLAPNLGWENVDVNACFRKHFRADVRLVQDGRAAALAEYLLGAGTGAPVMICITLGTGIGSGIIIDGKIFNGAFNTAGEVGHIIVEENGLPCECGKFGCLETYASGTAILNGANQKRRGNGQESVTSAEVVFEKAGEGDRDSLDVITLAAKRLGIAIANIVNVLSPNRVIFSGGMCVQEALFIRPVREYVARHAYSIAVNDPSFQLVKAGLGEDAPMIGAGMLYKAV
jgi:glucokinase